MWEKMRWDGNERKMRKKGKSRGSATDSTNGAKDTTRKPRTRRKKKKHHDQEENEKTTVYKNKTDNVTEKKQISKTAAPSRAETTDR